MLSWKPLWVYFAWAIIKALWIYLSPHLFQLFVIMSDNNRWVVKTEITVIAGMMNLSMTFNLIRPKIRSDVFPKQVMGRYAARSGRCPVAINRSANPSSKRTFKRRKVHTPQRIIHGSIGFWRCWKKHKTQLPFGCWETHSRVDWGRWIQMKCCCARRFLFFKF